MPYKDKERQKEAVRKSMAKARGCETLDDNVKPQSCETLNEVKPPVTPSPVDGWPDVKAYISREVPGMANLERLQRIAGALGKRVGDVWFGVSGLTMEDIGSVLGTKGGKYAL